MKEANLKLSQRELVSEVTAEPEAVFKAGRPKTPLIVICCLTPACGGKTEKGTFICWL